MTENSGFGWMLLLIGIIVAAVGAIWILGPSIPWLGRLPGDIRIERDHFRLYLPLATCLLVSLVLTLILWLARLMRR
jgi:hypothetical protein